MILIKLNEQGGIARYPYTLRMLKKDNPNVSLPSNPSDETLAALGAVRVQTVPRPAGDVVTEATPTQQPDSTWQQTWEVREFTDEERQAQLSQWRSSATISRRQGKQQLIIDDLDEAVETAIANVTDTKQRKLLQAWYNDADPWERDNQYLQQLGTELGLTNEQIDTMFKEASKL